MGFLLLVLIIWNVILTIDYRSLEKNHNKAIVIIDEMFEEKQRQIDYLRDEIKKDNYFDDEPPL